MVFQFWENGAQWAVALALDLCPQMPSPTELRARVLAGSAAPPASISKKVALVNWHTSSCRCERGAWPAEHCGAVHPNNANDIVFSCLAPSPTFLVRSRDETMPRCVLRMPLEARMIKRDYPAGRFAWARQPWTWTGRGAGATLILAARLVQAVRATEDVACAIKETLGLGRHANAQHSHAPLVTPRSVVLELA